MAIVNGLTFCVIVGKGWGGSRGIERTSLSISQYSLPYVCLIQTGSKDDKSRLEMDMILGSTRDRAIRTEKFFHLMVDLILLCFPFLGVGVDEPYLMDVHVPVRWNESCCLLESEGLLMLYCGSPK